MLYLVPHAISPLVLVPRAVTPLVLVACECELACLQPFGSHQGFLLACMQASGYVKTQTLPLYLRLDEQFSSHVEGEQNKK